MGEGESKDVEELKGVLRTLREEAPGLIKELVGPLREIMNVTLDEERAKQRAKAISVFYKELVASGISQETALKLTEQQFISPAAFISRIFPQRRGREASRETEKETE